MSSISVQEQLGKFGTYQKFVCVLVSYAALFLGFHILTDVFLLGEPKYRCYIDNCDNQSSQFYEEHVTFSIPNIINEMNEETHSSCSRYSRTTSNESCENLTFNQSNIENCKTYILDQTVFKSTAISEFNLVCDRSWYSTLSSSIFQAGILVGSAIFGMVSDRYGRKTTVMLTAVILFISSTATAFSTTIEMFSFFRFLTAASSVGLFETSYVLGLEYVGASKRVIYTTIIKIVNSVGTIVLGVLAYFIRNWRALELSIALPGVTLLLFFWVLPESLSWLVTNGKHKTAVEIIEKLKKWNKQKIQENCTWKLNEDDVPLKKNNVCDLMKSPRLRKWSLNIFFNFTVNSFVYFGLALDNGHMHGDNIYSSFCILSFTEIFFVVLFTFIQVPYGSRRVLSLLLTLCGLSCASSIFVPPDLKWLSLAIAVTGRGSISASFGVLYLYSSEIFPTTLRGTCVGLSSTIGRLGSILAPVVLHLGKRHPWLPMIAFSLTSITAGLLTLILPETHKRRLPETIEDAEKFGLT